VSQNAGRATLDSSLVAQELDRWAQWLLAGRHGGHREVLARWLPRLYEIRDTVLDNAAIEPGAVVLDVGAGNGLIGFGAADRVGEGGRVIFSDVSDDLLGECRRIAKEAGVASQCEFVRASADDLAPIRDASVDVVTTRSVLIYLSDKLPAFREMFRVLRSGGRISLFEPINRFGKPEAKHLFYGFDVRPVQHLAEKLKARHQALDEHSLTNFDERDLFRFAEEAGFIEIILDYRAQSRPWDFEVTDWNVLMRVSGNPLDPSLGDEIAEALTPSERAEFEAHLRPQVERAAPRVGHSAQAFLSAVKPGR
jgi:arsenite methyltransferase